MVNSAQSRDKSKSPEHSLARLLQDVVGLVPAQIQVALDLFVEHQRKYYGQDRGPGEVIYTAVSRGEPAGKPISKCELKEVSLTAVHEADLDVLHECGTVELRMVRLVRMAREAFEQGGLLSYEDLSGLLGVDTSTIRDIAGRARERGIKVLTRGAVKDIGRDPSHKREIAELLARGETTTSIRAMMNHSERAIGRYQHDFSMVLYLLFRYPHASDQDRRNLGGLSRAQYEVYVEVAQRMAELVECAPHLERLRRRFEVDPEGMALRLPPGKTPAIDADRRLKEQHLAGAVRQKIQEDLDLTRRVAAIVSDDVMSLLEQAHLLPETLRPGETVIFVDRHEPFMLSGDKLPDRTVIPVRVPLQTEEIKAIWRDTDLSASRRRAEIAVRIAGAAAEQEGVMSIAGLAELVHVSPSTLSADLRAFCAEARERTILHTKGHIEDAGATLTHKAEIIALHESGLTGEEISWLTRHAPMSRDRYISTYQRAAAMMRMEGQIPEARDLARVVGLRLHVAGQYVELLSKYHPELARDDDAASDSQIAPDCGPHGADLAGQIVGAVS